MRILVTGHDGYIGTVLVHLFKLAGHEVVGVDSGLFSSCRFTPELSRADSELWMDIRDLRAEHFDGVDAVVHLAGISNDPLGDLNPDTTYQINHLATLHVAQAAKAAGVTRFAFSSSCSIYGAHGDDVLDESAEFLPVTPYGESKVLSERDLTALADDRFSPTFLRNATAYGVSPRLRGDLVVNNLVGYAVTTGQVLLKSDGSPWRPLVHIEDIARAFLAVVEAPRDLVHLKAYNVGRTDETYRIREVAEIVADVVPGSELSFAEGAGPDKRNYRVDCSLITRELPGFQPQWTVRRGVEELYDAYLQVQLTEDMLTGSHLQRIKHIRARQEQGVVDEQLRVTAGEGVSGV
ncbi:SDR family oxidoreductase [Phytoactinopolyspora alkaliphila]|uniref:SDR family oxidoreductase n=1 Tax=Phytoactinopolyspora alkaliphila TaxID=1783498 RepID=A0A6N9YJE0_9ACTN|nr:SDR family oxidoreductase [Phytoactinopolyspora alkaliphila]NED95103.1 SDR family oxidoreductase [Phytoactinopolyspora alkaliphila]